MGLYVINDTLTNLPIQQGEAVVIFLSYEVDRGQKDSGIRHYFECALNGNYNGYGKFVMSNYIDHMLFGRFHEVQEEIEKMYNRKMKINYHVINKEAYLNYIKVIDISYTGFDKIIKSKKLYKKALNFIRKGGNFASGDSFNMAKKMDIPEESINNAVSTHLDLVYETFRYSSNLRPTIISSLSSFMTENFKNFETSRLFLNKFIYGSMFLNSLLRYNITLTDSMESVQVYDFEVYKTLNAFRERRIKQLELGDEE